jgi:FixJ family two-component response regulator
MTQQSAAALASVIVIDDDRLFRRSLTRLLEAHGYQPRAYESFDHFEASGLVPQEGCLILDLNLPRSSGLEIQNKLLGIAPALCIVFLTGFGRVASSVRAMKSGAVDFLEKPVEDLILLRTVDHALTWSRTLARERGEREDIQRRFEQLTSRQRDVFALITAGLLNKQAATELGLAERTVKFHRKCIMERMGAESLAELARIAERIGQARTRVIEETSNSNRRS